MQVSETRTVGLVAGWGRFPIVVAEALRNAGHKVVCVGIIGHADAALEEICDEFKWFGLTKMGHQFRYFQRQGVESVTMAGKVFKTLLFQKNYLWHNLPDWTCLKFFIPVLRSRDRKDDTLLGTVTDMIESFGFDYTAAVDIAPELLVSQGVMTRRKPTAAQKADIRFAWEIAKEMGRLDIGQSVAVKGRAILAVEAVEGTDECIRRAGSLCSAGEFVVVKVAKPQQDMRFDVPTVGLSTLEVMRQSGGRVLAIEAEKTIVLDQDRFIKQANQYGIAVTAIGDLLSSI